MEDSTMQDFTKPFNMNSFGGDLSSKILMRVLKLDKLEKLYSANLNDNIVDFVDAILKELGIELSVDENELKNLPDGSFISISNHPFGVIDGLILAKLITSKRPDFRLATNNVLNQVELFRKYVLSPYSKNSIGLAEDSEYAMKHLKENGCLGLFPAGEVSTYKLENNKVADKAWQDSAIRFLRLAEVPIVPIYFSGGNSVLFHVLSKIHPVLQSAKLPSEMLNKKNKKISVRIGRAITLKEQQAFASIEQFGRFLRAKTYALGSKLEIHKFYERKLFSVLKHPKEFAPAKPHEVVVQEIGKISLEHKLFSVNEYDVFCVPARKIPAILHEIGRLREITFREIGEGTNHALDLDEYDLYYEHLVVWDKESEKIVGAYRVGKGKDILMQYSVKGLYSRSLFKMNASFIPTLNESLELGRSFIVKEYQKKPLPLFLLWKGILLYLLNNPDYKYLIGPVSISNEFSKFSKGLIVEFLKQNYYDEGLARHVKPKKKFKVPKAHEQELLTLLQAPNTNLKSLDKLVNEIEKDLKIPVLLKKYLSLNSKIISFNIDPKFNNCLDGLMILDIYNIPVDFLLSLAKEFNKEDLIQRIVNFAS